MGVIKRVMAGGLVGFSVLASLAAPALAGKRVTPEDITDDDGVEAIRAGA